MQKRGSLRLTFIILLVVIVVLALLYFLIDFGALQALLLVLLIVVIFVGGGILIWEHTHGSAKLKRKLKKLESMVPVHPVAELEGLYNDVYTLYMKLPHKHQTHLYTRLHKLRSQLEAHLKNEKKVKDLLPKAHKGRIAQKRKVFTKLMKAFESLPSKVQDRYYQEVVQLRQKLEGKKK